MSRATNSDGPPKSGGDPHNPGRIGIGEMARRFDVSLRTLRFYEDRGLLTPRRIGKVRLYSERDATRLESILRCKQLGFTLNEISVMIADAKKGPGSGPFQPRQEQIRSQIAFLEKQRTGIDDAIASLRHEQLRLADH